jgi:PAS domain S-box-containing protein
LLDSLEHGLAVLDREGVVLAWNQAAEQMWGLQADHVVNRHFFTLPFGDGTQRIRDAFDTVQATGARPGMWNRNRIPGASEISPYFPAMHGVGSGNSMATCRS